MPHSLLNIPEEYGINDQIDIFELQSPGQVNGREIVECKTSCAFKDDLSCPGLQRNFEANLQCWMLVKPDPAKYEQYLKEMYEKHGDMIDHLAKSIKAAKAKKRKIKRKKKNVRIT
jgi:hypothetical protein